MPEIFLPWWRRNLENFRIFGKPIVYFKFRFKQKVYPQFMMLFQIFVTAGLGGMSGAQPKAGVITGCVTIVAEVGNQ